MGIKSTHFLFQLRTDWEHNGPWKSFLSDWVHPRWTHRTATTPAAPFPPLPRNLSGHDGGEPGHDHTDWAQFSPAHSHVLFPQQLVLYWSLSVHCHYPQNAGELRDREEYYFLSWMHDSTLFLHHFCYFIKSHAGCNGIWPLCCHLQPFALQCHHVLSHLLLPHDRCLYFGHHWIHNPYRIYVETLFMQHQYY